MMRTNFRIAALSAPKQELNISETILTQEGTDSETL
jgi:hypothetical protein